MEAKSKKALAQKKNNTKVQQFLSVIQKTDHNISVGFENQNMFEWRVCIQGPLDSLYQVIFNYQGGLFIAILKFPTDYPNSPPAMQFITQMFHPNSFFLLQVYKDGNVCISILHQPEQDVFNPQEKMSEKWRPVLTIEDVIVSVISLLMDPNLQSPANVDAAVMYKKDSEKYKKTVRKLARKSIQGKLIHKYNHQTSKVYYLFFNSL